MDKYYKTSNCIIDLSQIILVKPRGFRSNGLTIYTVLFKGGAIQDFTGDNLIKSFNEYIESRNKWNIDEEQPPIMA